MRRSTRRKHLVDAKISALRGHGFCGCTSCDRRVTRRVTFRDRFTCRKGRRSLTHVDDDKSSPVHLRASGRRSQCTEMSIVFRGSPRVKRQDANARRAHTARSSAEVKLSRQINCLRAITSVNRDRHRYNSEIMFNKCRPRLNGSRARYAYRVALSALFVKFGY